MNKLLLGKIVHFLVGAFVLAYGVDMTRLAELGLPPWDVLHEGLARLTPMSFGVASIAVGVVLIVIAVLLQIRPRLGTIANMVVVGLFIDAILSWGLLPGPAAAGQALGLPPVFTRYAYLIVGAGVVGLGSAWYVTANLGAGPRDSLTLGLTRLTGWQLGIVRTLLEGTALLAGWLLGGPVGTGTIIGALLIGWAIQGSLLIFRRLARWGPLDRIIELPLSDAPPDPSPAEGSS